MRADTAAFADANASLNKEPRFVAELDFAGDGSDLVYFPSHDDMALPGGAVAVQDVFASFSATSQTLKPEQANASIGNIAFNMTDVANAVRGVLASKYASDKNIKGKRLRVYMNYKGLPWSDAALLQTQRVEDLEYQDAEYTLNCMDVQRYVRTKIFRLQSTNLKTSIGPDTTTIEVYDATQIRTVKHGTSYTDAPSAEVAYFKLDDEVVRVAVADIDTVNHKFNNCERGALNTRAVKHEVNASAAPDKRTKVEEYVYLEMPAAKLAYALLTGDLYGQAASLPDGWHAGIDAAYIKTSAFTSIGDDLWNTADDTQGFILRFEGEKEQDAKKFIEEQIMLLMGCYMPVHGDGSLGLRRFTNVLADAAHSKVIDVDNTVSYGTLKHDMAGVRNRIDVGWNYNVTTKEYTRHNLLIDSHSGALYGYSDLYQLKFRGLHGSRHTGAMINAMFERLRDRYTFEPLLIQVAGFFSLNNIEVGDIVKLSLPQVQDYINDQYLNRSFEVQRISVDYQSGRVTLQLYGSTTKPNARFISGGTTVLPDAWYTSAGSNIATTFAANYTNTGGIGHITGNITLTGNADLNNAAAIYYHDGDLTIDAGVTVTLTNNVQLRVKGFLTVNGVLDGEGNGITTLATQGGVGSAQAQGGIHVLEFLNTTVNRIAFETDTVTGKYGHAVPVFNVAYDSNTSTLYGLPDDLRGSTGPGGGNVYSHQSTLNNKKALEATGGTHGNSGAGLAVISRGLGFGANGNINLSGAQGTAGGVFSNFERKHAAGSGAGGSHGGLLVLMDGNDSLATLNTNNLVAYTGPLATPPYVPMYAPSGDVSTPNVSSYYLGTSGLDRWSSAHRIQYIPGADAPEADTPTHSTDATTLTLTEYTNTPKTAGGNLSSIEALVTPPADNAYDYSNIYYRVKGQTVWTLAGPANNEYVVVVPSDGTVYEFMARAVSIHGNENDTGPLAEITTINVTTPALVTDPPVADTLVVPNVTGLELFEQANNTEFTGRDAKFAWRKTSSTEFYELGSEPTGMGADSGALDLYFKDYWVRVYNGADLLREEFVTDNWYTYTQEKNAEDYQRINNTPGAYRTFTVDVRVRTRQGQYSERAAKLTVSNPAPALPAGVEVKSAMRNIFLSFTASDDLDYQGCRIWLATSSGFSVDDTNKVMDTRDNYAVMDKLPDGTQLIAGTTYYLRFALFDGFGFDGINVSAEYVITTQYVKDADILDIVADKIKAGSILAALILANKIDLATNGVIKSMTTFAASAGVWLGDDGGTNKFYVGDGANKYIKFDGSILEIGPEIEARGIASYSTNNHFERRLISESAYQMIVITPGIVFTPVVEGRLLVITIGSSSGTPTYIDLLYGDSSYFTSPDANINPVDFSKNRKLKTRMAGEYPNTGKTVTITTGSFLGSNYIGFEFTSAGLNGVLRKSGGSIVSVSLFAGKTPGTTFNHVLEIVFVAGVGAYFYVDGTLQGSITTTADLPVSGGKELYAIRASHTSGTIANQDYYFGEFIFNEY